MWIRIFIQPVCPFFPISGGKIGPNFLAEHWCWCEQALNWCIFWITANFQHHKSSWMKLSLMKACEEFKSALKFCKMRGWNLYWIIVSSFNPFDRCDTCSPHSPCSPPGWFGQPSTSIPTGHNICFFGNPNICSSNTYRSQKRGRQQADWRRSECASWKWTGQWTGAAKCQCKWWKTNSHAVKG